MQGFEGIVSPHSVTGCESGEFGYCLCFFAIKPAIFEYLTDKLVVEFFRNDVKVSSWGVGNQTSLACAKAGSPLSTLIRFWVAIVACLTTDSYVREPMGVIRAPGARSRG